jgi:ribosomal protein L7/L12
MSLDNPASLFGIPRDYAFMLLGGLIGFPIGLLAEKWRGNRSAHVRPIAGEEKTVSAAAPPIQEPRTAAPPGVSLVVNGKTLDIDPATMAEIQNLIRADNKIEAIKGLREASGLGLAEAKTVVESLEKVIR